MFIEIKELTKIYNNYIAVDKINFEIEKNKTVGLLGPNGCGKTTTIGMILGLVSPSKGKILIKKVDDLIKSFEMEEMMEIKGFPQKSFIIFKNYT